MKLIDPKAVDALIYAAEMTLLQGQIAATLAAKKPFVSEVDRILANSVDITVTKANSTTFFGNHGQADQNPASRNEI